MSKIAIFGANGYAGDAIRTEALRRGHEVLALSRSANARQNSANSTVEAGDLYDPEAVKAAAKKADIIVIAIPAREINGHKLKDAIPGILQAAAAEGTRVGVVGGAGSLRTSDNGPLLLQSEGFPPIALPEATSHAEALAALRESKVGRWFYVSPAAAFGAHALQTPVGSYLVGGDTMLRDSRGQSALSDQDYAKAFLDEIENPKHENTRFSVIGAY